jgi:hypothetical protein
LGKARGNIGNVTSNVPISAEGRGAEAGINFQDLFASVNGGVVVVIDKYEPALVPIVGAAAVTTIRALAHSYSRPAFYGFASSEI